MSTTTPPPPDDREKVARAVADAMVDDIIHWDDTTATDGPCDGTWDSLAAHLIRRGWARTPLAAQEDVAAILASLDLPARDTRTWWNGYDVGQQDATGVPANGDGTYNYALDHGPRPQEAHDAR